MFHECGTCFQCVGAQPAWCLFSWNCRIIKQNNEHYVQIKASGCFCNSLVKVAHSSTNRSAVCNYGIKATSVLLKTTFLIKQLHRLAPVKEVSGQTSHYLVSPNKVTKIMMCTENLTCPELFKKAPLFGNKAATSHWIFILTPSHPLPTRCMASHQSPKPLHLRK